MQSSQTQICLSTNKSNSKAAHQLGWASLFPCLTRWKKFWRLNLGRPIKTVTASYLPLYTPFEFFLGKWPKCRHLKGVQDGDSKTFPRKDRWIKNV